MKKLTILMSSIVLLVIDLVSKSWIQTNLRLGQRISVIPNFFEITYVQNTGGAWSMLDASWMRPIFLLISMGVMGVCIYYYVKENNLLVLISIGLVMAGNLGNFYDRLVYAYVRDMLSFNIFGYPFPVFNVADMCLVVGFGLLMLYVFLEERKVKHHD
ncbi:MAG TPA: signal peptidase II [Erysipelothrix sp.]|nr:signal peptidase II [Erysipelothrix sp.]